MIAATQELFEKIPPIAGNIGRFQSGAVIDDRCKAIGESNVIYAEPQMVGEDFARFGSTEHKVPTVLYWLGTVPDERMASGDLPGLHSPFYYPEIEKSLKTAIKVNTDVLIHLMTKS